MVCREVGTRSPIGDCRQPQPRVTNMKTTDMCSSGRGSGFASLLGSRWPSTRKVPKKSVVSGGCCPHPPPIPPYQRSGKPHRPTVSTVCFVVMLLLPQPPIFTVWHLSRLHRTDGRQTSDFALSPADPKMDMVSGCDSLTNEAGASKTFGFTQVPYYRRHFTGFYHSFDVFTPIKQSF
ncbi:unnamed protein product [Soboliphyme baturini]|uniref:Uncharacterized protein n=1 Tax=Soboliphyme baturini TaxID=241478 RepID=A0A183IR38_9BILA|nr:unnamed protein product [Soboliphyme baturini]